MEISSRAAFESRVSRTRRAQNEFSPERGERARGRFPIRIELRGVQFIQVNVTRFVRLYVSGEQNTAESRYQHW